jgi:hypothetical protein
MTLARQQNKADKIAQRIGQGEDLGCQTALGFADSLTAGPPFAPWPWR